MTIQISCASENKGLFAILDEKYIGNIGDLPFSPGNPDMVIQSSNDINAWIDITGYRGMIIEGNESFINDTPEHAAIVQYDASGHPPGYLDGITKDVTITQEGEYTIARLDVKMRWHTIQCGKSSCWNIYHSNSASFQDSEISPHRYKPISEPLRANITQYNNSVYENIGININYPDELAELKVSYRNSSIIHTMKNAHVETTSTGVYFANISDVDYWHVQGFNISHLGNLITLNGNMSKMDLAELKITGLNIYESISANTTTFTLSRQEFTPEAEVQNPLLLGFLSIVVVLCAGIYFSWRSLILRL